MSTSDVRDSIYEAMLLINEGVAVLDVLSLNAPDDMVPEEVYEASREASRAAEKLEKLLHGIR